MEWFIRFALSALNDSCVLLHCSYFEVLGKKEHSLLSLYSHFFTYTDIKGEKGTKRYGVSIVIPQFRAFFMCFVTT